MTRRLLGSSRDSIDVALETINLTRDADRRVREYSLGMRQRLGLGRIDRKVLSVAVTA